MRLRNSDKIRNDYKIYLEPILATACEHKGNNLNITRSKYIRYFVIRCLINDGYTLNKITDKFNKFYKHQLVRQGNDVQ